MEEDELRLYRISNDEGESWTEQWLTEGEALMMSMEYEIEEVI